MSGKKKEGLAVPPLILLVVDLTQGDKEQAWFVLFICRSPRVLQHSPVMTIWFCFQIKGDKQVCLTAWPKAPGSVAELPAPSNTSLCMCVPYTLAPGPWHRPRRALERKKPPSDQPELWLSRGWRQTLWKHWLLSIPSGLGGAEVRKSSQEREQRKYQEKKEEGDRVNVALHN